LSTGAIAIAASGAETYALRADGSVWAWGWGWSGYPSLPKDANPDNKPDKYVARRLDTLERAATLGGGPSPSALTQDGRAVAWNPNMSVPPSRRILATTGRIVALASYSSVLALRDDGFVCTMGSNLYGSTLPGDTRLDIGTFVPLPAAKGQAPLNLVDDKLPVPPDVCAE
jgi:alpha-tubulin suppressor-like RCC1 family protein